MLRFQPSVRAVVALTVTALMIAACKGSTTGDGSGGAAGGTSACIPRCGTGEECQVNCTESYFVDYDGGCPDGCTPNMDSMPNSCFCDPPPPRPFVSPSRPATCPATETASSTATAEPIRSWSRPAREMSPERGGSPIVILQAGVQVPFPSSVQAV
jgi:hypothetical protein